MARTDHTIFVGYFSSKIFHFFNNAPYCFYCILHGKKIDTSYLCYSKSCGEQAIEKWRERKNLRIQPGFEPRTFWILVRHSYQLSYWALTAAECRVDGTSSPSSQLWPKPSYRSPFQLWFDWWRGWLHACFEIVIVSETPESPLTPLLLG